MTDRLGSVLTDESTDLEPFHPTPVENLRAISTVLLMEESR